MTRTFSFTSPCSDAESTQNPTSSLILQTATSPSVPHYPRHASPHPRKNVLLGPYGSRLPGWVRYLRRRTLLNQSLLCPPCTGLHWKHEALSRNTPRLRPFSYFAKPTIVNIRQISVCIFPAPHLLRNLSYATSQSEFPTAAMPSEPAPFTSRRPS
jgi:hypothetical protein